MTAIMSPHDVIVIDQVPPSVPLGEPLQDLTRIVVPPAPSDVVTGFEVATAGIAILPTATQPWQRNPTPARERMPMGLEQFFKVSYERLLGWPILAFRFGEMCLDPDPLNGHT